MKVKEDMMIIMQQYSFGKSVDVGYADAKLSYTAEKRKKILEYSIY